MPFLLSKSHTNTVAGFQTWLNQQAGNGPVIAFGVFDDLVEVWQWAVLVPGSPAPTAYVLLPQGGSAPAGKTLIGTGQVMQGPGNPPDVGLYDLYG